jgi:heterodisulfide reductase subunit C
MRLIQLQLMSQIIESKTIWTCASCLTCSTRCPNDIDIATVMDECRQTAMDAGIVSEQYISSFHRVFLKAINRFGRVHELSMLGQYKLVTGKWFEDLGLGLSLLVRGKLKLLPHLIKGRGEIRKLFKDAGLK